MQTLIKNAIIVNEGQKRKGWVMIGEDTITDMGWGDTTATADKVVDAEGMMLIPGVIDDHVHFRDPGLTHKADMDSESAAAAAGGVTSIFDMPNTMPQTTSIAALNEKFAYAANHCHVNYSFFLGATNDNIEEVTKIDPNHVCGVKVFMGSSTGNMLVDDRKAIKEIFKKSPTIIMVHCEDSSIINANMEKVCATAGNDPDVKHHPEIRSEAACYESSRLAIEMAHETGARLHLAHITTKKELELIKSGASTPRKITAEACPAHLLFSDNDYLTLGTSIKCNPAIKTTEDRDALRQALKDGLISLIGTDHAPHTIEEKTGGCKTAASGMPMIQFSLVSMLRLSDEGVFDTETIVERMCHAPARLFNIKKRGFIRKGYKADLVLLRREKWTLTKECIISKCGWSPLEGQTFDWKVDTTFCNGHAVYANEQADRLYIGKDIEFDR